MGKTISSKFHRMRAEDLKRQVELSKRKAEFKIPPFVVKQFDIDELHEEGRLCYRLVPKQGFNGTYIMYLYSSKLCFRMNPAEWMFLAKTALACHAGIFLPMYPLAPEHCCREVFRCWNRRMRTVRKDRTWNAWCLWAVALAVVWHCRLRWRHGGKACANRISCICCRR